MSNGWSLYVAVLVIGNLLGAAWLLWWMRRGPGDSSRAGPETTGHVWDGDLREFNNPLPRWWLWLFIITMLFAAGYLVAYPGLGNWPGTLGWSSHGAHAEQAAANEAVIQRTLAPYKDQAVAALARDPGAVRIGRNLFVNNCTQCHGSDGRGAPGFPNLTDADWLWGGSPDTIVETITNGRTGVMPAWGPVLGDQGVTDVVAYVLSLSGRSATAGDTAHGKEKFIEICSACHGEDGHGNPALGAPNLTDGIWLFGGSPETIRDVVTNGRQGMMPAHGDRLGPTRIKLLAAYVLSIGPALPEGADAHAGSGGT